jgi:hypothetical protein
MQALRALAAAVALAALAALPPAAAHTSVFSEDGRVRAVVGQLNEPVSTYAVSGLDVCFQQNTTARAPVAGVNAGAVRAVLRSPGGEEMEQDLRAQFGRPGCFTFAEPYVLTQPGQYVVDLSGDVNGTAIHFTNVTAGGPVVDRASITFPDTGLPGDLDLQADIDALEARLAALEARPTPTGPARPAPAPAAALLLVGLAALAAARRLR